MFERLIKELAHALDKAKIPYLIIGGQAVLIYGTPRLTRDIDITLGIDTDEFERIQSVCQSLRLKILPQNPFAFAESTKVLPVEDPKTNIRIDFIFSFTPYEKEALKRGKAIDLSGQSIRFASLEDVIIFKLIAGRAIDIEDVKSILIKNHKLLDHVYVEKWLRAFEALDEYKGLFKKFNQLLSESRSEG